MNLERKLELLENAVRSIAEHDDAPQAEVEKTLRQAKAAIDRDLAAMRARRKDAK
jgi:hypothetical protein